MCLKDFNIVGARTDSFIICIVVKEVYILEFVKYIVQKMLNRRDTSTENGGTVGIIVHYLRGSMLLPGPFVDDDADTT